MHGGEAAAAIRAEEECKTAAAADAKWQAILPDVCPDTTQAEQAAARHKKPNARGLFTRSLGPALASLALILLGAYVIRELQTQHAPVHNGRIANSPQPVPLTPHPKLGKVVAAPSNRQPTTDNQSNIPDSTLGNPPEDKADYYQQAVVVAEYGDYAAAIVLLTKAITIHPNSAKLHTDRGIYYCRVGNLDQAVVDLTQAIDIAPTLAKAYHNRGVVRVTQGKFNLAINDFDTAIRIDPAYSFAYTNRDVAVQKKREMEGGTYTTDSPRSTPHTTVRQAVDHDTAIQSAEEYYRKRAATKKSSQQ